MHECICEKLMRLGYIYDYTDDGFVTPGGDDEWMTVEDMIDNILLGELERRRCAKEETKAGL
jgi:hypothetical protein